MAIGLDMPVRYGMKVSSAKTGNPLDSSKRDLVFEKTQMDPEKNVQTTVRLFVQNVFTPGESHHTQHQRIDWKNVPDEELKAMINQYIADHGLTSEQWQRSSWLLENGHRSFYRAMSKWFEKWEKFLEFMEVAQFDWQKIPEAELKAEVEQYIKNHNLSYEQWQSTKWLSRKGHNSFYEAMRQRFQGWENFLVFMRVVQKTIDWKGVPEAELKGEIERYIKNNDLSNEQWQNSRWLSRKGHNSFYEAMRQRFQGWENFLVFMRVVQKTIDWKGVPEAELKAEVAQYIKNNDLSNEQWQNSKWLHENGHQLFYKAMRIRFQGWENFLVFMDITKFDWQEVPEAELKAEIKRYIKNHDLSNEQWQNSYWLGRNSHSPFYLAMRTRFQGWENFLVFMDITKFDWQEVPEAELKAEIKRYIKNHDLSNEQWQNSYWLGRNNHQLFYKAMFKRFKAWETFLRFMGIVIKEQIHWQIIPENQLKATIQQYIHNHKLTPEQWQNSYWLRGNSHNPFYIAMRTRFQGWENFLTFMAVTSNPLQKLTRSLTEDPSLPEDKQRIEEYKNIVSSLGENTLLQFVLATNPELQAKAKEVRLTLKKWIGTTQTAVSSVPPIPSLPEALFLLLPEARELAFVLLRESYFSHFEKKGEDGLLELEQRVSEQPTPTHRSIYQRVWDYYVDILGTEPPPNIRLSPSLHQKMGAHEIQTKKRFLIADDVGTGKTLIAIMAKEQIEAQRRKKSVEKNELYRRKKTLVLCPSEMVETWHKRLGAGQEGYFLPDSSDLPHVVCVNGSKDPAVLEKADYIVMNYDKLDPHTLETLMRLQDLDYLVLDEAHNVKNIDGKWSRYVRQLSLEHASIKDGYTVILSATPLPNKIHEDLPVMLQMLQPEKYPDLAFLKKQINNSNGMLIRSILMHSMLRHTQTEVLHSLPNLIDPLVQGNGGLIRYDLTPAEKALYQSVQEDEHLSGLQKLSKLNQICLDPCFVDSSIAESSKYRELSQVLSHDLTYTDNVVVFVSHFRDGITRDFKEEEKEDMHLLAKLKRDPDFAGVNFYRIDGKAGKNGEGKELSRENILKTVRNTPQGTKNVILATIDTASEGIDMTFASRVIFPNLPYTKAAYHQALGRLYRPGQTEDVHASVLVANSTTEEGNFVYIKTKDLLIQEILDGKIITDEEWEEISRDFKTSTNSLLSFMTKTDHQKLLWLWGNMAGRGAESLKNFFERYGGQYAKEFVRLYMETFETSYGGSNFRFLCRNILEPLFQERADLQKIADLGSGPLALAAYLGQAHPDKEIHALDLNRFAIEAGQKNLVDKQIPFNGTAEVGSFTKTNFENGSQDMAICSLAFHATHHPNQAKKSEESERAQALFEFHRILRQGGVLVLLEKKSILQDEELIRFGNELKNFGFRIIPNLTGRGYCADAAENGSTKEFENISIVCEKISEPVFDKINLTHLAFTKKTKKVPSGTTTQELPVDQTPKEYKHHRFEIKPLFEQEPAASDKEQQEKEKQRAERERIHQLLLTKIQILIVKQSSLEKTIHEIRELGGKIVKTRNKSGSKDYQIWFEHTYLGNLEVLIKN